MWALAGWRELESRAAAARERQRRAILTSDFTVGVREAGSVPDLPFCEMQAREPPPVVDTGEANADTLGKKETVVL